jgi:hypothetical protein
LYVYFFKQYCFWIKNLNLLKSGFLVQTSSFSEMVQSWILMWIKFYFQLCVYVEMTYLKPRITVLWGLIATHFFCFGWHFPAVCASAPGKWWFMIWVVSSLLLCWPDEDIEHKLDVSHTSSWSDRPWSPLSMSICVPEMIISMLDNLSHSNGHWHYISYAKLHIVDNNSLKIRVQGIKTTCCTRKKWLGSFHLQKIALVLVKILYCFGAKSIRNLYRYFICMSPPLSDRNIHV